MRSVLAALLLASASPAFGQDDTDAALPIIAYPTVLSYVQASLPADRAPRTEDVSVTILVELDATGTVNYAEVMEGVEAELDAAALAAVQQMRFQPARTVNGPVEVAFPYTYTFPADAPAAAPPAPDARPGGKAKAGTPPADDAEVDPVDLPITQGPQVVDYVEAPYPAAAEAEGLEGTVVLLVTLDDTGTIEDVAVSEGAGHGFDEAALDAVRAMRFSPALTEAGPVGVVFEFAYAFTLEPEVAPDDVEAPVNVQGVLRRMGGGRYVEAATVLLKDTEWSTTSDVDGAFSLRGVPPGAYTLTVRHPGYVETDEAIEVVAGELTEATVWVRALTYRDNEAVGYYEREKTEVTRRTLSIAEIKRIPGTFGDPVKVIQTLPGAGRSPFGTGLLLIRGANPEDTAVYVDGVRLPIIYHLTGTTSVLSPEIVQSVDYLPGGYGVQFGRSMGGTVNVRTKDEFDEKKITIGIDILDAQVWFEGNVAKKGRKKHGLALGARRSYIDAFIPLFTGDIGFNIQPVYWDYQAKWVPELSDKDFFSLFIYGFQDTLSISTPADQAQGSDADTQGDIKTEYQSHRITARYKRDFSKVLSLDIQPSFGVNVNSLGLGDDFGLDNTNWIAQLRAELNYHPHPIAELVAGIDMYGGPYQFTFKSPISFADLDDPLAERDPIGFTGFGTAWFPAPFVRLNLRPLKDSDRWLISTGLRYDNATYFIEGSITGDAEVEPTRVSSWDPRVATRFVAFEKGDMTGTIKASTGLYQQPPQPFESIGISSSTQLLAERSWNSSIGFEHRINQAISWDVDVFYRQMDSLIGFNNGGFGDGGGQPFANNGEGYAAGVEVIVRHAPVNRFFGWISYTYSRSFRRNGPEEDWVPFSYDQPHIFSAQGGYNFPFDIGLSAQLQVVSGNPFTPRNAGVYDADTDSYNGFRVGASNSERLPTFVQTSFRIDKTFTFKRWQMEIYLDLINALRGVNPEQTVYNYDFSEYAFVRGLPFIPNLGLEFRILP